MLDENNTILIVDDIELNREILKLKFEDEFKILQAGNGQEAYELVKKHESEIVVVLLDLMMPILDGSGFLALIRKENLLKDVPIFIITAQEDEELHLDQFDYGITDVITKPFNAKFLVKRVKSQIELYKSKKSLEYINMKQSLELLRKAKEFEQLNLNLISSLALAIEFRSGETGGHVQHIKTYTDLFLTHLNNINFNGLPKKLNKDEIALISFASILHDIGKISIPDCILNKPGKLTKEEFEIMKTHTTKGAELISQITNKGNKILKYAYDICKCHHEKYDGKGYPCGLVGDDIPLIAQVVSMVDVYDALTQERCYKKAFPHDVAVNMIKNGECGQFNPDLVAEFLKLSDEFKRIKESPAIQDIGHITFK